MNLTLAERWLVIRVMSEETIIKYKIHSVSLPLTNLQVVVKWQFIVTEDRLLFRQDIEKQPHTGILAVFIIYLNALKSFIITNYVHPMWAQRANSN